jgi:hypothetical protein
MGIHPNEPTGPARPLEPTGLGPLIRFAREPFQWMIASALANGRWPFLAELERRRSGRTRGRGYFKDSNECRGILSTSEVALDRAPTRPRFTCLSAVGLGAQVQSGGEDEQRLLDGLAAAEGHRR